MALMIGFIVINDPDHRIWRQIDICRPLNPPRPLNQHQRCCPPQRPCRCPRRSHRLPSHCPLPRRLFHLASVDQQRIRATCASIEISGCLFIVSKGIVDDNGKWDTRRTRVARRHGSAPGIRGLIQPGSGFAGSSRVTCCGCAHCGQCWNTKYVKCCT